MAGKGIVEHKGMVDHCDGDSVHVKILSESACASCKLNGVCGMDTKEKIIEVSKAKGDYKEGEQVNVGISEKLGYKALFYGYLLSFLVGLVTLLIAMAITGNEGLSGLLSLVAVVIYYLSLRFFRNTLKKSFQFSIHKTH